MLSANKCDPNSNTNPNPDLLSLTLIFKVVHDDKTQFCSTSKSTRSSQRHVSTQTISSLWPTLTFIRSQAVVKL